MAQYGGKILGGGTNVEVADGTWSPIGLVVIEFESMAKAKEWYNFPRIYCNQVPAIATTPTAVWYS